jgi:ubiquinone/menaquinone biosynthesis C-methylase UbiE
LLAGGSAPAEYKKRSFNLVPWGSESLLDLGSGTGDDALSLAERCGPETSVVGIERRLELVDEAIRRARNVALNVRFAVGDVYSLPFADRTFDVVRADCLFQELDDHVRALREIVRVTRRGGLILISDREQVVLGRSAGGARPGAATEAPTLLALVERAGLVAAQIADVFALFESSHASSGSSRGVTVSARAPLDTGFFHAR